ncbi:hypothetical protein OOK36_55450 [Streptomyces sp. NBC_00365]|uniref:hypothetical protein n=1 Tax=Streptomyces sp. NBC_00365 TaxID=2975726 RepID=UPI00225653ED|nr:hypothetical protein [Streptomyces sp. NBC_00365]MCX5097652.1 hypothetical protein [Streptomyces sp. NBC_00365]
MSNETPPTGAGELPEVDEDLAKALTARGDSGVRALGMLRDAYRVVTGTLMGRPVEVAAACVRSAADALLGLPGAPDPPDLRRAAKDLLDAVDAFPPPALRTPSSGASAGPVVTDRPGWERVTAAAEALRGELGPPGGFHQPRVRGIFEQLMGATPGAAQGPALDVWAAIYGVASRILHGRAAGPGEAVHLYTDLRNLLVPLYDRAERVVQLAAARRARREGGTGNCRLGGRARHLVLLRLRSAVGHSTAGTGRRRWGSRPSRRTAGCLGR